ncbi:hypothetical protein ABZS35_24085, partial [Micromonospora sp. NPDC005599]|uniref:hypothetical protein n=1 Tax=Micromonospora sp. NPDC005599 TaxID=3155715 RepID=UPI0033B036C1
GVGSERAYELLGHEALQTYGGSGFLQELAAIGVRFVPANFMINGSVGRGGPVPGGPVWAAPEQTGRAGPGESSAARCARDQGVWDGSRR